MKHVFKLLVAVLLFTSFFDATAQNDSIKKNYFQLSPRIGYDMPTFKNNTPFIDYKGGMEFGISLDYYWRNFGIGLDYDNIKNQPQSSYPTTNIFDQAFNPITNISLSEDKITRTFFGIGPNYKYNSPSDRFTAEFNTRFGISSIKGGRVQLRDVANAQDLNFHAGYDAKGVFSFKGQMRFNYFFSKSKSFGAHIGAYYLKHFGVSELSEGGKSASYWPLTTAGAGNGQILDTSVGEQTRLEPCDCDISSVGVFAGVTYRFPKKTKEKNVCPVCKTDHTPHCCLDCGCSLTVTAKDKFTGETLPKTDVVLTDMNGNIVKTGTTNSYGVVVFEDVKEDNYLISGKLYGVTLEEGTVTKADFETCRKDSAGIQKVIKYADRNFILQGNAVECNTPKPLEGVMVTLKNVDKASQKSTMTDANGKYVFHLKEQSNFTIFGKKDNYVSQVETITTKDYDRNTTLFVKLEVCLTYVECNTAIPMKNINFDLDKDFVREDAKLELNKLVTFMKTYPMVKVELSSHTDSQGSDAYNEDLSQRRATNSARYIVSQGISPDRITAKGYGEYRLLNHCANGVQCADSEHEVNRRTEFKVLCPE